MASPRKIIIDTDPGKDDAVAILLALASPELDVLALTAVAGNVPLSHTETNARKICELAGRRELPVIAGCDRPLLRALVTAEHVHGKTGLDGPNLPKPSMSLCPGHAVDYIIDTVMASPEGDITLCPIGPLTNIAVALSKSPAIAGRIREIVLMGGAFNGGGNVTPTAEFNIFCDPDAAKLVFASGVPLTILPLDVTHKARTSLARLDAIRNLGNETGRAIYQLIRTYARFDESRFGPGCVPLHDPCVIAYLLRPELFDGAKVNVEVETTSELTLGMTVADFWSVTSRPANATFMQEINNEGFFDLLTERLATLP